MSKLFGLCLLFIPQADISAWELATILRHVSGVHNLKQVCFSDEKQYADLPQGIKRHFYTTGEQVK